MRGMTKSKSLQLGH